MIYSQFPSNFAHTCRNINRFSFIVRLVVKFNLIFGMYYLSWNNEICNEICNILLHEGLSWLLSRLQIFITVPQKYVILFLRVVILMASWPIVTHCICKYLSITIKCATCNCLFHSLRCLEFSSSILKLNENWIISNYIQLTKLLVKFLSVYPLLNFDIKMYLIPKGESSIWPHRC